MKKSLRIHSLMALGCAFVGFLSTVIISFSKESMDAAAYATEKQTGMMLTCTSILVWTMIQIAYYFKDENGSCCDCCCSPPSDDPEEEIPEEQSVVEVIVEKK